MTLLFASMLVFVGLSQYGTETQGAWAAAVVYAAHAAVAIALIAALLRLDGALWHY